VPRKEGKTYPLITGTIRILGGETFSTIEQQLREVPAIGMSSLRPYLRANIKLVTVRISDLWPCALYVLENALANVNETRKQLAAVGVDIFHLTPERTSLWLEIGGYLDEDKALNPPIVEVSEDDENKMVIIDGLHRVSCAKELGEKTITVIKIEGTAIPIASPPEKWEDVKRVNVAPSIDEKRRYRFSSSDGIFLWIMQHTERFARGLDLPDDVDPIRWIASYVWQVHGSQKPFPEKLSWLMRA